MKNLTDFAKEVHSANRDKGFYDKPVEVGTHLMLITSELAEALEADRHNLSADRASFELLISEGVPFQEAFKESIKDSYEDEIADAVIRLLDHCGYKGIDLDFHVKNKLKYNSGRVIRHGKRY
jgi:NTP pyrophosphatase (non-canonical NTP hydrolase)